MTATRRLAAVVVADVVGYSRLMEADEAGTLAALRERRKAILEPVVRALGGRVVKLMGDGALIEFASAVNAVAAALELQEKFSGANAPLAEDRRIVLRIGINLGDVVGEGSDIYGDGVNIAARLEALAEPGGICISAKVHDEVRGKLDAAFEDMGERQLKNIVQPVRAYRSADGGVAESRQAPADSPAIAVLPLTNMSGDPEQQYFSDGITEDIVTELSRFRHLRVVARNSSFRYRGGDFDMIRVGRELGVHYLVEGSVRRMGARIRIAAQLIDARTGHHLWAENFDRDQDDIFAVQDRLVRTIVATLAGRLQAADIEVARRKPPASLAAYECVLRADALPLEDPASPAAARLLYERAIALDPGYGRAHALLAISYDIEWGWDLDAPDSLLDRALDLAKKAVALDDHDSVCHNVLGAVYLDRRVHDLAEYHCRRALDLNRNRPTLLASLGFFYSYVGRAEEGIANFRDARALDSFFEPSWYWPALGAAHFHARQYEEAIAATHRSSSATYRNHAILAASHAYRGELTAMRRHAAETLRLAPRFSIARFLTRSPFKFEADAEHLRAGLRKAGLPE
jgi:TolB-like protein/Tfp pilus assembly protein PilF